MSKLTIRDVDLNEKKVLVRVDYNVPLDKYQNITDDTRIKESIPTIKYLLEKNCKIILCSHLGRPKGKVAPEFSLKPVAKRLSELLKQEIKFASDCIGDEIKKLAGGLKPK
ncbi:MAG: phosphoglycerate kinase, partial [Elusimicrobiota bacterium]|nr:phosphoglycerate kinase [Elusimicrobiota bacterium]